MIGGVSDESARAALEAALGALDEHGESHDVSPTEHSISTDRLFKIAEEVRGNLRPDANIEWRESGALRYALGPSMP
jgi:hypothetical protein